MLSVTQLAGFGGVAREPSWQTIFQQTLDANVYETFWGYTIRQVINSSLLTAVGGISKIRITCQSSTTAGRPFNVVNGIRIQQQGAGDVYDFAAAPTLITNGGGTTAWNIAAGGGTLLSDEITFALDTSLNLVISMDNGGDSGTNFGARGIASLSGAAAYTLSGSDGSTVDTSGYSAGANNLCGIQKIEAYA